MSLAKGFGPFSWAEDDQSQKPTTPRLTTPAPSTRRGYEDTKLYTSASQVAPSAMLVVGVWVRLVVGDSGEIGENGWLVSGVR